MERVSKRFQQLLAAGDPDAVALYREHQAASLGSDPLAEDACEWPAELSEPGTVLDVPADAPILGWRMWAVHGSYLAAPFVTAAWNVGHKTPGVLTAERVADSLRGVPPEDVSRHGVRVRR